MSDRDYRERIFDAYLSRNRGPVPSFDADGAVAHGRYLARVLSDWLPRDREAAILDLGCGNGSVLHVLGTRGFTRLSGVDVSSEQVEIARQVCPAVAQSEAVDYLERRPAEFDLLLALDLIEHLGKDDVLPFLDACRRALRPGGRLILRTPNADSPFDSTIRYGDFTHEVCFNPHSLGWLLELCGFDCIEAREAGPRPLGIRSAGRFVLWRLLRRGIWLWNLIETGTGGSGVYTRVFFMSGTR